MRTDCREVASEAALAHSYTRSAPRPPLSLANSIGEAVALDVQDQVGAEFLPARETRGIPFQACQHDLRALQFFAICNVSSPVHGVKENEIERERR